MDMQWLLVLVTLGNSSALNSWHHACKVPTLFWMTHGKCSEAIRNKHTTRKGKKGKGNIRVTNIIIPNLNLDSCSRIVMMKQYGLENSQVYTCTEIDTMYTWYTYTYILDMFSGHGITCTRCNSLTSPDCRHGYNLPTKDCGPDPHFCLTYWSSYENNTSNMICILYLLPLDRQKGF